MAGACLTFAHLFSFQVSYADLPLGSTLPFPPAAAGTKMLMDAASLAMGFVKKKLGGVNDRAGDIVLKRGIIEVDFTVGLLTLADKDKAIASQEFQAFKRKFAGDGDLLISLHFQGNECWDITTQSRAEKRTLNHLLECISRKLSFEQTIEAGKDEGLIGIDKTVIKAGLLNRKAKTIYKVDERFIVLVPGKLLLFKGPDISSKRVRYVTTLARARVEATHGQPSFQLLVPNTKALSLAASSAEAAKEWISALEDSIEYANNQGAGNQSRQAAQGRPQQYDDDYMSNRLQNLQLADRTAVSANPLKSAGPQYYSQPAADQLNGNRQQMYMNEGPYNQEYRGAEHYTDMQGHERSDSSEYMRQNPRLMGKNFDRNQASTQGYPAPYPASGLHNDRIPIPRNIDRSYAGGPSNMFAAPHNTSSGFAPSPDAYERRDPNTITFGGDRFSQGGGSYSESSFQSPSFFMDPQSNGQQRVNVEYPNAKTQFDFPLVPPQNPCNCRLGGVSDGIFHGSPMSGQECNYYPNIIHGGCSYYPSDSTKFNNGGKEMNDRGFCNASQGNYATQSHQQHNNSTQAPNRNKVAYDP